MKMDNSLPLLLKNTLNNLLETHSIRNWKLVSGKDSTLIIHWDSGYGHHDLHKADKIVPSVTAYKKKTPSQCRRDRQRSERWRHQDVSDSGYKSPRRGISYLETNINSVAKGYVNNTRDSYPQGMDISSPQIRETLLVTEMETCSTETPVVDMNTCVTQINSDSVTVSPSCDVLHYAKESSINSPKLETTMPIAHEKQECVISTFEYPTVPVHFRNVTVNDTKQPEPVLNSPKKFINVKCLQKGGSINIESLYYCKKCHIDLKQPGVLDCTYNSGNSNLCKECCLISEEMCPVCYKVDFGSFDKQDNG